jgi:hypothetical protein
MKIQRLETHDRFQHFIHDQSKNVVQGAEDCLKRNILSLMLQEKSPYIYIFYHSRTLGMDEKLNMFASGNFKDFSEIPEKVGFWQPRLTKPLAQTNSYLFRAKSHSDLLEVKWILPPEEMWDQYKKGNITESETILWSINMYQNHKVELEKKEPEDLPDERIKDIYMDIGKQLEKPKFEKI